MGAEKLLSRCVSVDLEVDPNTGRICSFAAIRSTTTDTCTYSDGDFAAALRALDEYAAGTEFVLGHNVIEHDLLYRPPAPETIVMPSWPPGSATLRRPPSLAEKPAMH